MSFSPAPHDAAIGVFNIYVSQQKVWMDIHLDQDDFQIALQTFKGSEEEKVFQYLANQLKIELNNQSNSLEICSIEFDELRCHINGEFPLAPWPVQKINIKNTCLVEVNEKQSNLIHINSEAGRRSFRLHDGRREISVDL